MKKRAATLSAVAHLITDIRAKDEPATRLVSRGQLQQDSFFVASSKFATCQKMPDQNLPL